MGRRSGRERRPAPPRNHRPREQGLDGRSGREFAGPNLLAARFVGQEWPEQDREPLTGIHPRGELVRPRGRPRGRRPSPRPHDPTTDTRRAGPSPKPASFVERPGHPLLRQIPYGRYAPTNSRAADPSYESGPRGARRGASPEPVRARPAAAGAGGPGTPLRHAVGTFGELAEPVDLDRPSTPPPDVITVVGRLRVHEPDRRDPSGTPSMRRAPLHCRLDPVLGHGAGRDRGEPGPGTARSAAPGTMSVPSP